MAEKTPVEKIKKAKKPELEIEAHIVVQPVGVSSVVEMPGDPLRLCGTCEHFDLGSGTCHNGISGRLKTTSPDSCVKGWYPCTTRWPLHKRMGIEQ